MSLTPAQVQFFRHNGFLRLPVQLSEAKTQALKSAIWRDIENEVEPVVRRKSGRITRISDLWGRETQPIFRETIMSDQILDCLECLIGPNIEFIRNRHNHATLRVKEDSWSPILHRDVSQWTRTITTVLIYLEDTNLLNGCTRVIPGSHVTPVTDYRDTSVHPIKQGGLDDQAVSIPMPAGGMVAIDSMVIHGAGQNLTDETRMSMTFGYHAVDELIDVPNPKRVLVRGSTLYQGNDR